jgi:hypothetical protein
VSFELFGVDFFVDVGSRRAVSGEGQVGLLSECSLHDLLFDLVELPRRLFIQKYHFYLFDL